MTATASRWTQPRCTLRFHENYGKNVELRNEGQTAERVNGRDQGMVLLSVPMLINRLYEFRLEEKDFAHGDSLTQNFLRCGVAIHYPALLSLPAEATEWGYAVVINRDHVTLRGVTLEGIHAGKRLEDLSQGSVVGLGLDHAQCLHLYINGMDQGIVIELPIPFPCYPFVDLLGPYKKITALPVKHLL